MNSSLQHYYVKGKYIFVTIVFICREDDNTISYGQEKTMMYFIIKTFCLEHSDTVGCKQKMKYQLEIFYLVADDIYNENKDDFMTMTIRSSCMIVQ